MNWTRTKNKVPFRLPPLTRRQVRGLRQGNRVAKEGDVVLLRRAVRARRYPSRRRWCVFECTRLLVRSIAAPTKAFGRRFLIQWIRPCAQDQLHCSALKATNNQTALLIPLTLMFNRNKVQRRRFLIFSSLRAAVHRFDRRCGRTFSFRCLFSTFRSLLLSSSTCRCPLTRPQSPASPPAFTFIYLHFAAISNPRCSASSSTLLLLVTSIMVANGNRRFVLVGTAALLITCCSFTPSIVPVVTAEVAPTPVQDFAWVRSGPNLYIEGGYVNLNNIPQFTTSQSFALDLSVSWPVTAAPWRALTNGTAAQSYYAVSSPNNQTILTFKFLSPATYTIMTYNAAANTWGPPIPVTTVPDILSYGQKPVMDPTSGLVYIAGSASMDVYNTLTQAWTSPGPIITSILSARAFGADVYNPTRKTIMYVGGYNYGVSPTHFDPQFVVTEYSPSANKWSVMVSLLSSDRLLKF